MNEVTTIGLDLAKNVFQVHGVDASGGVVIRKPLRRRQVMPFFGKLTPCSIGVEACATSHHRARELQLDCAPTRLLPPFGCDLEFLYQPVGTYAAYTP